MGTSHNPGSWSLSLTLETSPSAVLEDYVFDHVAQACMPPLVSNKLLCTESAQLIQIRHF